MIRWWLAAALAIVAPHVSAHATLVATTPGDGARLDRSPSAVVLEFDEPVVPLAVALVDSAGARIAQKSKPEVDGTRVRLVLDAPLRNDGYIASYRIVSADSHVIAGAIAFSIGPHAVPERAPDLAPGPTPVGVTIRALLLAGTLVAAGVAVFLVWVAPFPGSSQTMAAAALIAVVAALLAIDAKAVEMAGEGAGHGAHAPFASGTVIAMAAAVVAWFATVDTLARRRRVLLTAAAVAMPACLAASGHALTVAYSAIAIPLLFAHLAGAAFWAGSLVALWLTMRAGSGKDALRRFSALAQVAVPIAIAAGLVFAALELRTLGNLDASDYGRLVVAKVAVTLLLLSIATLNRFALLPAIERGEARASVRMKRSIAAEILLVAVLAVLGATLGATPPPRDGIVRIVDVGELRARVALSPSSRGADISLERAGEPLDAAEVSIEAGNEVAGIGPLERRASRLAAGRYRVDELPLAPRGRWSIVVRARIDDFTLQRFETTLDVR